MPKTHQRNALNTQPEQTRSTFQTGRILLVALRDVVTEIGKIQALTASLLVRPYPVEEGLSLGLVLTSVRRD